MDRLRQQPSLGWTQEPSLGWTQEPEGGHWSRCSHRPCWEAPPRAAWAWVPLGSCLCSKSLPASVKWKGTAWALLSQRQPVHKGGHVPETPPAPEGRQLRGLTGSQTAPQDVTDPQPPTAGRRRAGARARRGRPPSRWAARATLAGPPQPPTRPGHPKVAPRYLSGGSSCQTQG